MLYKGLHFRGGRLIAAMMGAFFLIIAHSALAEEQSESSSGDVNYIVNGDFSEATIPVNGGNYGGGANITVPSWEFGTTAGLAKGNSAWIRTTHSDPYAAYMQRELKTTYIQQTFTLLVAGRYRFSFYYKARDMSASATGYQLAVSMDGVEFKSVTTASTSWRLATVDIELPEGVHVLKFYAKRQYEEQATDISVIIDDVSLRKITASDNLISNGDFSDTAISANSGSWGVGSANASAQSWEIGNSSGFTTANSVWRNLLYSDPYAALLHYELTTSTLSQRVWVPSDGRYRFSFWYTARNGYQLGFRMSVSMDGTDIAKAMTATYDWSQCAVEIELTAGFHDLKFYGERGYSSSSEQTEGDVTIVIDDVALVMANDIKSAVWTGQGDAANVFGDPANWQCYDGNGNLLEGKVPPSGFDVTLAADADWRQVPAGSLAISSVNLDGHHLQITGNEALGSIVSVRSGDNCVANGDFTDATIPAGKKWGNFDEITISGWTLLKGAGVTSTGSDWTSTVFSAPYAIWMQDEKITSSISQKLTVPSAGIYRLSFWYKGRDAHVYTLGYNLAAAIDGQEIAVATTTSYSDWMRCSAEVELSADEHTLELYGRGRRPTDAEKIDKSVIIDNVSLYKSSASRITVEVPEGVVFDNSRLKLEGALTFVKKGLGTFVASAGLQTYDGGTLVEAGVLRLNALGSTIPLGATDGTSPISIAAGAKFDLNGQYEMDAFHIVLDGGTIANYGGDIATDDSLWKSALHYATLTADSYLKATGNFLLRGGSGKAINLGGNTLTATLADGKTLYAGNVISNGTVRFESAKAIFYALEGFSTTDADFDISAQLAIHAPIEVRNWTVRHEGEAGLSEETVTVGGVFSPVSDYFCDTQLADGATLDLSGRDTALDVKSLDTANEKDYRLSFADNATIFVYFGERRIRSEVKVVAWTAETKPANLATLRFKVSPKNRYRQRLVVKEDGIYAEPADGMMIIVR